MKAVIETNEKHGKGYQVRVLGEGTSPQVIGNNPYTLRKAVVMAKEAVAIYNRRAKEPVKLKDALAIDPESVLANREYDDLSGKMADKFGRQEDVDLKGT